MRAMTMTLLFPLVVSSLAQECGGGEAPVITDVSFPETVPGDGTTVEGTISFTDADAGVHLARLDPIECEEGWTCSSEVFDLTSIDPTIPVQTEGRFAIGLACDNPTAVDAYFVYSWTLIDIDNNESEPYPFSHTCLHTSTDTVPHITYLEFPEEVPGDGSLTQGYLEFEDDNAGVIYAYLDNRVCPSGADCPDYAYDMLEFDPDFDTYYWGNFAFTLRCTNASNTPQYFEYAWSLEDIEGNESEPAVFGFLCSPGSSLSPGGGVDVQVLAADAEGALRGWRRGAR